jgi:hypothetical protein
MNQYYGQKVKAVTPLGDYRLEVVFADGYASEINLAPLVGRGPIYEPLRDVRIFQGVKVSPEWGVLEWSDDLELSPGALRAWCEAGHFMDPEQTDEWIEKHTVAAEKVA